MFASASSPAWLLKFLEMIGVDRSQFADGAWQFEWANTPIPAGSLVVLIVMLVAAFVALWLWRRTFDSWPASKKFLLVFGSLAVFIPAVSVLLSPVVSNILSGGDNPLAGSSAWANLVNVFFSSLTAAPFVAVLGISFWVLWVYRWEIETCSSRVRAFLGMARMLVLATLALILFAPEMVTLEKKELRRTLLVERDKSQSMAFQDAYRNEDQAKSTAAALGLSTDQLRTQKPSRAEVLDKVLAKDEYKFLRELQAKGKLLVADFDDTLTKPTDPQPPEPTDATPPPVTPVTNPGETSADKKTAADPEKAKLVPLKLAPLVADGRGSDLWLAIHEPLARNPAAIILFTDGQHTGKESPLAAAQEAKRQNVKLYIVGLGDPARPKNLRVDSVYVQPNVWKKDPFQIQVEVSSQDIDPQDITVELIEQKVNDSDGSLGPEKVVAKQSLLLNKSRQPVGFEQALTESGKYVYSARITPLDDESNLDDNRAIASPTQVRDKDNIKVLLVAGAPTWEYRLVQKLLTRDPEIDVKCWLQSLDEERAQDGDKPVIERLPLSLAELNEYGVILLFDPNPMEFDVAWINTLKEYVSTHSGGVLFMAGPKYTGSFLTNVRTEKIADIIPVRFGDVGAVEVMTMLSPTNRPYPLRVVPSSADNGMLKFMQDTQQSLQRWESLPGIFWSFPSLSAKPTAQVLLEHSDTTLRTSDGARPLLVRGRYGSGNTAYIGFNGTWRWRQIGREAEFFDKFWVNMVRELNDARSSKGRKYGSLNTERDRYEVGDKIAISARLNDASYEPLKAEQVEATLRTEDGAPISIVLKPVMGQDGVYQGFTAARRTGLHVLSVDIPSAEGVKPTVDDKNFTVELPRVEMNQQWLNKPLLDELAKETGGQYFDLNQLDALAAAVPDQTETLIERGPSKPLWDLPGVVNLRVSLLVLLVGLLSVEWALRKKFKLL